MLDSDLEDIAVAKAGSACIPRFAARAPVLALESTRSLGRRGRQRSDSIEADSPRMPRVSAGSVARALASWLAGDAPEFRAYVGSPGTIVQL